MSFRRVLLLSVLALGACGTSVQLMEFEGISRTHSEHALHCNGFAAEKGDAPAKAAATWQRRAHCFLATPTSYAGHMNDHAEAYSALAARQTALAGGASNRDVRCIHLGQAVRHERQAGEALRQYFVTVHEALVEKRASGAMSQEAANEAEAVAIPAIQARMNASTTRQEALERVVVKERCGAP